MADLVSKYKVVVNANKQYGYLPLEMVVPLGWKDVNKVGTEQEVVKYIQGMAPGAQPMNLATMLNSDDN